MSSVLSKGFKLPDTGDRGSSWFPDLEHDISQMNSHKHDGVDSEKINVKDIVKTSAVLLASGWGTDLGGSTYKQTVTVPSGFTTDDALMKFVISGGSDDGYQIFPTVHRIDSTTFDVSVNDATLTVKITYG